MIKISTRKLDADSGRRKIMWMVFMIAATMLLYGCASPTKAKASSDSQQVQPAGSFDEIGKEVKTRYICPNTGMSIAESEAEGQPCPAGQKVMEITEALHRAGWNKEQIFSAMEIFIMGKSIRATVETGGLLLMVGNTDAPLTMIEFTDMQCPHCSRYNKNTFPAIKSNYIDTGKLKYYQVNLPLSFHQQAFKAAEALYCANEQGKFVEMRNMEYDNQRALDIESLKKYAVQIGMDGAAFSACLDNSKFAGLVNSDLSRAGRAGINGTPAFVIGPASADGVIKGKIISGAQPTESFTGEIDRLLGSN